MPESPAESAVSSSVARSRSRAFAWPSARYCWNRLGLTPAQAEKMRWKWAGLIRIAVASSSSEGGASARASIRSMARRITA